MPVRVTPWARRSSMALAVDAGATPAVRPSRTRVAKPGRGPRPRRWRARSSRWRCRPRQPRRRRGRAASRPAASPALVGALEAAVGGGVLRPSGTPPPRGPVSRIRVEVGAGRAGHAVRRARTPRSPGGRRSARPGRRGSPWWPPRARSRGQLATCSLMARATAAPPATASEPPSQKSFWTSTMMSARMGPTVSSGPGRRDAGGVEAWGLGGAVARADYWNHNVHYQPVILRARCRAGCGAALEVGCGDGLLCARQARRPALRGGDRDRRGTRG